MAFAAVEIEASAVQLTVYDTTFRAILASYRDGLSLEVYVDVSLPGIFAVGDPDHITIPGVIDRCLNGPIHTGHKKAKKFLLCAE